MRQIMSTFFLPKRQLGSDFEYFYVMNIQKMTRRLLVTTLCRLDSIISSIIDSFSYVSIEDMDDGEPEPGLSVSPIADSVVSEFE